MAIQCPSCDHALGLKAAKPGRYTTKCPKCAQKLLLLIPADPDASPTVSAVRTDPATKASADPVPAVAPTLPPAAGIQATSPDATSAATGAWSPPQATEMATAADDAGGETRPNGFWATDVPTAPPNPNAAKNSEELGFVLGTAADPASPGLSAAAKPGGIPSVLGGYQVIRELGRGGMGAVYLAKQISLNRNVALKVMKPEWADNPTFVSRFTREAYAAAQLVHHNVVQIYDFGQDRGTNFFSMEFVQGQTLSQLVKTQKKLDPEAAVGFILQAARGLKYAHDQGMIHRDIKPDNLLLNDQGVVKVADLGLVKTPALAEAEEAREANTAVVAAPRGAISLASSSGQITLVNSAMGTPAFMAPEQAKDAASVDLRADIYSLGCTLYDLVTGRPPFEGKTAIELITKHQTETIIPPEAIVKRVPKALSDIILKMVAKKPEDRYSYLGDVIKVLEGYLGLPTTGVFSPREEHANLLAESVEAFNKAPSARLRPKLILGGFAACLLVVIAATLARQPFLATGFLGLGLMTALAYFIVSGVIQKKTLFLKTQQLLLGSGLFEWLMVLAGLVLFATVLVVFHLVFAWIAFGVVAAMIAIGFHIAFDKKVEAERREPIERTEDMLKSMRLHGLDEDALRQFVCKYSGERWEEFYESLFGYEAKMVARDQWGRAEQGRLRSRFGAWRDPLVRWIDAKQQSRREARERKLLQKIEEKGLEARGVNLMTARRQARRAAEAMVMMAAELKEAERLPHAVRGERIAIGQALRDAAAKPEMVLHEREQGLIDPRTDGPLNLILGPGPRFLAGAVLLTGCLFWMHQNNLLTKEKLEEAKVTAQQLSEKAQAVANEAVKSNDVSVLKDAHKTFAQVDLPKVPEKTRPLSLPMVPQRFTALFHSFSPGVAGLILLFSSFFRGVKIGLFAIPGAAIALFGPQFLPGMSAGISSGLGLLLGALGALFGRTRY
ncbi:protein kinase [Singulisphaera sp. Ch08]|uniref:Protein kinase n=1 Tax=Singulisphaera sp. Ch08 TaxID=3120278 RepID=A0AAU7CS94_9BACT